ncbi:MAG: hypothetical protein AAGE13_02935 [Pseudomonadota bacterium]
MAEKSAGSGQDLVFIVGRQRSGTTVFRQLLVDAGAMDCDEIFHGNLARPNRFFAYVAERAAEDRALVHPQHHIQLFRDFVGVLRAKADGATLAMDVKYFGLNLIPAREDVEGRRPFMITYMQRNHAHVVHIVRRNKLRVHVSAEISKATGRWSVGRKGQVPTEKPQLTFDRDETLKTIGKLQALDEKVSRQLSVLPGYQRLTYEEMFRADGQFSDRTMAIGSACMGGVEVSRKPANQRMNPEPLSALIANHDEICAAVADGPHAWMLDDA